ncbi:hypothetical protein IMG5_167380, partial [Ichthyophthirius multifiliis]
MAIINAPNNGLEDNAQQEYSNKLFVWGCSDDWQLGIETGPKNYQISDPVQITPDYWQGKLEKIYAQSNYSMSIDTKGNVFSWGSGEFGRLGYEKDVKYQKYPKIIETFSIQNIIVTKIALGTHHSAACTNQGKLYTWGQGVNGQLGHGSNQNEEIPKKVKEFQDIRVLEIACGDSHTMAIISGNLVYGWGFNQAGQLGFQDLSRVNLPKKIMFFNQKEVVQIQCGKKHSIALTVEGQVYSWGSNEYGQLGIQLGKQSGKMTCPEQQI